MDKLSVLIASDSFKGSVSSLGIADLLEQGIHRVVPDCEVRKFAIADGGEGTVEAIVSGVGGEMREVEVSGPLGDTVCAHYGFIGEDTAILEMAEASGITLIEQNSDNALRASTWGVGQVMLDAIDHGAKRIYIGLGGSATSDGGAGMAKALGIRFLNADGEDIPCGLVGLGELASIDCSQMTDKLDGVEVVALTDVTSPLTGPDGAVCVFGPQKGIPADQTTHFDAWMARYAEIMNATVGRAVDAVPGSGAAGGLGAALVAFCGAPVSAVRSWVMVLAAELSRLAGRRAHPLSSASVTALGMAALDPGVTGQLGFLLSVACVCGICALGGYVRYVLRVLAWRSGRARGQAPVRAVRAALSSAQEALALTVVSQVVTMPLTCATFGTLSLVAPLANVLLAPLFSLVLVLGLAVAVLVWAPPLQALALVPCDAVGTAVVRLARRLAGLPLACVPVSVEEGPALALLGVLLAALLVVWPRVTRRALVGALCAALALGLAWHLRWRLFAPACVRVLDVGQGDAILVTDGSSSLLVDTGPGDAVVEACARSHVTHLDAVLVTHLHDDHVGGIEALGGVVSVSEVLVAEGVTLEAGDVPVSAVRRGDVVRVGRFSLEVLSPSGPVDGLENEDSVVCSLAYEDEQGRTLRALLTGDAERDVTDALVEAGDVGDVDLLKVGHHGSEVSVSEGAAAALMPEVSVASVGEGNAYGHPDPACVEILEDVGSTFLCTMDVGDVCVEPGVEGPVVSCQRGSVRDATLR